MGELDKLLKQYASRPTAAPPDNLEDRVWREIRLRQEQRLADSFVDWLAGRVWRARSVYACVISAVAMGVALA
jgi:hypothetical protein